MVPESEVQRADVAGSAHRTAPVSGDWPPCVWLLMGHKAGDNTQVRALAEALGWPFETKQLSYRRTELLTNVLLGPNLAGIVKDRSSPLAPPWPDLILTAGRRNEPVARWIQRQTQGKARIVHLGRPWARLERFDLIVTTPQYRLPERGNILHNTLPLHGITDQRLAEAATQWGQRWQHLPRPFIAVFVGGHSGPFTFDTDKAACLGQVASRMARDAGGSVLLTTSARTPPASVKALADTIDAPAFVHQWTADSTNNPYFGLLALADAFIVTGDSMSMLTEACVVRKPVHIFDLSDEPDTRRPCARPRSGLAGWRQWLHRLHFKPLSHRLAMRYGPRRMVRDVGVLHQRLVESGRAVWFGNSFPFHEPPPALDDLGRAVTRVRALFSAASARDNLVSEPSSPSD